MGKRAVVCLGLVVVLIAGCSDQVMTPQDTPGPPKRRLQPAIAGEMGVFIKINGQNLTDPTLAARLRVDLVIDAGRPTFVGNPNNKTIRISPTHIQASSVEPCMPGFFCEVNVIYHDSFGTVPTLNPNEGILGDGDYTVTLYRDGSTLVSSKAIAVNHADKGGSNGSFLDESTDQVVTFFLNQNLQQIQAPQVTPAPGHARASTHLSATITSPSGSEITIGMCDTLKPIGSGSNGIGGTKKFAWDWDATGSNTEAFDTEFSTSTLGKKVYGSPGDRKFRLLVRDGDDNISGGFFGGHYAITPTKTVHVNGDCSRAGGHTIPGTWTAGSIKLVGMVMKNQGTTTWSSGAGYRLELWRDGGWTPLNVPLSFTIPPGDQHSFIFNLRAPSTPGTYAALYRMYHLGVTNFFGDANGRNSVTVVSGGGGFGPEQQQPATAELGLDPTSWTDLATSSDTGPLVLDKEALASTGVATVEYGYSLSSTTKLDIVLRFVYDPAVVVPAAMQIGWGGVSLDRVAGLTKEGEYWVRLSGNVPAGEGQIVTIPFLLVAGAKIPDSLGSLTLYSIEP